MFTASGLLVRFLKVFEKSGYQSVKWVRYLSKANGSYQVRVSDCRLFRYVDTNDCSFEKCILCCMALLSLFRFRNAPRAGQWKLVRL